MKAFRLKDRADSHDPALSTRMFTTVPDNDDDASDDSPSTVRFGSSDDNDHGKRVLDEKLARLRRAQKLLEKSQATHPME